jgi:hypothetical protein
MGSLLGHMVLGAVVGKLYSMGSDVLAQPAGA